MSDFDGQKTLLEQANQRDSELWSRVMSGVSGVLVNLGIAISAVLTVVYLTLLVEEAAGLAAPYGYILGAVVGFVAVIPAEMAMIVWRERLANDRGITPFQRWTAVFSMIFAGIFSALTTSSFFSYFLPQLFPASYIEIAPTLNVVAIVGAWIAFIMGVAFYSIGSHKTKQNVKEGQALNDIHEAQMDSLRAYAQAIRLASQGTMDTLNEGGFFTLDGLRLIANTTHVDPRRLGIGNEAEAGPSAEGRVTIDQEAARPARPAGPATESEPSPPVEEGPIRPTPRPAPNGRPTD
jgi:hypothetical protein